MVGLGGVGGEGVRGRLVVACLRLMLGADGGMIGDVEESAIELLLRVAVLFIEERDVSEVFVGGPLG